MKIEGRDKLAAKFRALPVMAQNMIGKAVEDSAMEIVGLMKRVAPHGSTGALIDSIRYEIAEGEEMRALIIAGGEPATLHTSEKSGRTFDEAVLMEFGIHAHRAAGKFKGAFIPAVAARPFFYPVWRAYKKRATARIGRAQVAAAKKVANNGN